MINTQQESLDTSSIDYFTTVENNISEYKSLGDTFIEEIDPFENKSSVDEEAIKDNYKFFFQTQKKPIQGDPFQYWFLLYSGEKFENIKHLIFAQNITPELQRQAYLFLQSMIDYCNTLSVDIREKYLLWIYDCFIGENSSFINYLFSYKYKFLILSQLLKDDTYSFMRDLFLGEFHYEFVFSTEQGLDNILKEVDKGGKTSALNALSLLSVIMTHEGGYAQEDLAHNIVYISNKILQKYNSPFFRYKILLLLENLDFIMDENIKYSSRDTLIRTPNIFFHELSNGYAVKISSDYASLISNMGYSQCLEYYDWKHDAGSSRNDNIAYEFYNFLEEFYDFSKKMNVKFSINIAAKIYAYLDKMYYNIIDSNGTDLQKICIKLLGNNFGKQFYDIFMLSIDERNNQINTFNNFVETIKNEHGDLIDEVTYMKRYEKLNLQLQDSLYNDIYPKIAHIFNSTSPLPQENKKVVLQGKTYNEILSSTHIDIYGSMNIGEVSVFMQELHTPEMISMIEGDLGVNITNLTLQNQVHLLRFLGEQTIEKFEHFKKTLQNLQKKESQYAFLNTFLACSKNPNIGDKLVDLASNVSAIPIFLSYAELISLQSEINTQDISSLDFLKTLLVRGEQLLIGAIQDHYSGLNIKVDERYSKELVKSGAFIKALIKNQEEGKILSLQEFNEKCPDFELELYHGVLFTGTDTIDLFDETYFPNHQIFKSKNLQEIISWSQQIYLSDRKKQDFIRNNLISTFQNPETNHLFLKEKNTGNLLGYCKMQGNYFGSLYIDPKLIGDFGIGDLMQNIIIQEATQEKTPIQASAFLDGNILERHINKFGGLGKEICSTPEGIKYLNFEWNSHLQIEKFSKKIEFKNPQELGELCEQYFLKGYILTHIKYNENGGGEIIFNQIKES